MSSNPVIPLLSAYHSTIFMIYRHTPRACSNYDGHYIMLPQARIPDRGLWKYVSLDPMSLVAPTVTGPLLETGALAHDFQKSSPLGVAMC